ncbi:MAG: hypothetical protein JJU15_20820 [Pararhodobacter sp.]|nr:hypothetical protein [Pararhodobacter sp.]
MASADNLSEADFESATLGGLRKVISDTGCQFDLRELKRSDKAVPERILKGRSGTNVIRWSLDLSDSKISLIEKRVLRNHSHKAFNEIPREVRFSILATSILFDPAVSIPEVFCVCETEFGWSIIMQDVLAPNVKAMLESDYLIMPRFAALIEAARKFNGASSENLRSTSDYLDMPLHNVPFSFRSTLETSRRIKIDFSSRFTEHLTATLLEMFSSISGNNNFGLAHLDLNEGNVFWGPETTFFIDFGQISFAPIGLDGAKLIGDRLWIYFYRLLLNQETSDSVEFSEVFLSGLICNARADEKVSQNGLSKGQTQMIVVAALLRFRKRWLLAASKDSKSALRHERTRVEGLTQAALKSAVEVFDLTPPPKEIFS